VTRCREKSAEGSRALIVKKGSEVFLVPRLTSDEVDP
jgi:hypothetical protein